MLVLNEENYNLAISCFWETPIEEHRASSFQKLLSVVKLVSHVDTSGTHLVHVQRFALFKLFLQNFIDPFFVRIGKKLITSRQTNHWFDTFRFANSVLEH